MTGAIADRIVNELACASDAYHRLILVVGPARSGKTNALMEVSAKQGWPRINVNLTLAEQLVNLTQRVRAARVVELIEDIVRLESAGVLLLDNLEILFAAELAQDPLRLMQWLSRNRTIVAAWPGTYDGHSLTYAEPGHHEFKTYATPDAVIIPVSGILPSGSRHAGRESK